MQLHGGFPFAEAAAQADYVADLGVSHLYLSPVLQAAAGSTHGYDVVDPGRVNEELGGAAGHARLCERLGQVGLGQLLDVVPNHMAIGGRDNAWWWDVLANGPASRYADYFDVDWDSPSPRLRNAVMLPILADHYGRELEAGRITLARDGAEITVRYFEHAAPLDPASLEGVLAGAAQRVAGPSRVELHRLADLAKRLPPASQRDPASVEERDTLARPLPVLLGRLLEQPGVGEALDAELEALNADCDALDRLLERQNYRLVWWRAAGQDLDYRRFFDINDLAAIRVEEPRVFADSHRLVLAWLQEGVVDGVRVDHVDGLYDPARYLQRLAAGAPGSWRLVEKILEAGEQLPSSWPVAGTTGYDWLNRVGGLLTYRPGWERLVAGYQAFTGVTDGFEEIAYQAKQLLLGGALAADLNRVAAAMEQVCAKHRRHRDYTRRDVHDVLGEMAAAMRVYRTYASPEWELPSGAGAATRPSRVVASPADVEVVNQATLTAGMRRPDLDEDLLGFVRDVLVGRVPGEEEAEVALRFQQLTGPVMAKAVEDTAFYRWVPLTSLNEVGGDPSRLDDDLDGFHDFCATAHERRPLGLLATSTHDTKRSEDVRARIGTLAEVADEWLELVERWWAAVPGAAAGVVPPDRNTAWLLVQTLVGAWPISPERVVQYLGKATREAKEHTSWTEPDAFYDEMVKAFAEAAVDDPASRRLVEAMVDAVSRAGQATSLAQKLLTLTAPGVPDLYQGTELWDLSLVDPDNRRPVDYQLRRRLLAELEGRTAADVWSGGDEQGAAKLAVVAAALRLRRQHPDWWGPGPAGAYLPLRADGPAAEHLVAFGRGMGPGAGARPPAGALTLATRWPLVLERSGGWRDTTIELPPGSWEDRLSSATWSGRVAVSDLLARLPVGLLVAAGTDDVEDGHG